MDETGAKPGDVFHDGVSMSQRFEIKKLIRQRYNLMGESRVTRESSRDTSVLLMLLGVVCLSFLTCVDREAAC